MKRLFTKQPGDPGSEEPVLPLGREERREEVITSNATGKVSWQGLCLR